MDIKKLIEEVLTDLGNNKSLTDVSSKIQIIVRLLGDDKLRKWYNCEFVSGYRSEELPDYRKSKAADIKANYMTPQGFGALHMPNQSVPVMNLGVEKYNQIMTIEIKENVSSIVEYSKHPENMAMTLSPYEKGLIQKVLGYAQIIGVHKVVPPSVFQTIIDNVQNRIIDLFMDLNDRVFNGEIDITSSQGKKEMQQVINNYTASIIQMGNGTIDAANSTMVGNLVGSFHDADREKLRSIVDEIEKITIENKGNIAEIAQDISDIRTELQSSAPQPKELKKSFKALMWGTSVTCKAAIEKLVSDAIGIVGQLL